MDINPTYISPKVSQQICEYNAATRETIGKRISFQRFEDMGTKALRTLRPLAEEITFLKKSARKNSAN